MTVTGHLSSRLNALPGLRHAFLGRKGGTSNGIYASLNCGLGSDDAPQAVAENRALAARHLEIPPDHLLTLFQIHSPEVIFVETPWTKDKAHQADAMVTKTPGIALGILAADCAPVLFADPKAQIIGAAHSGWQGALKGVLEATLDMMESQGADRANISAAIGPCISRKNYEVGPEFVARFTEVDTDNDRFFLASQKQDHQMFDLPAYAAQRLAHAGVTEIDLLDLCTYENEFEFFSYRRCTHRQEGDYGRNLSAIVLEGEG